MTNRKNLKIWHTAYCIIILLSSFGFTAQAQNKKSDKLSDDLAYYKADYLRYSDHIYVDHIRSVLLHREGWELSYPLIEYATDEKLQLSFDDLQGDVKDLKYTFIHCDANWQASDLLPSDYIEGFYNDFITQYFPSYNTLQTFTHYELVFPSENMKPTLSGNYLLRVYDNNFPEKSLITMRFMIFERKVSVSGRVHAATDINDRKYRQEVDFAIDQQSYRIDQPFQNLKVVLLQNGRWDNAITNLKPQMLKGNILDYNLDFDNVFDGINEFRRFDLKSLRYNTENVMRIIEDDTSYTAILKTDRRRPFQVYSLDKDINGKRLIKVNEGSDSRIEAEYVKVVFTLPYDAPLLRGNIFIMGGLTHWQFKDEAKMKYDINARVYRATMYLKQGYYNYMYVFLEDGKTEGDATLIEGNHEETENDYTILVYNRESGARFDRLISFTQLNSLENR